MQADEYERISSGIAPAIERIARNLWQTGSKHTAHRVLNAEAPYLRYDVRHEFLSYVDVPSLDVNLGVQAWA